MNHDYKTSTGAVATLYWSKMGEYAARKQLWGIRAVASWKAERLHEDTWHIPQSVSHADVQAVFDEILRKSDKAIVVFPHGNDKHGSSRMSVHTYNC